MVGALPLVRLESLCPPVVHINISPPVFDYPWLSRRCQIALCPLSKKEPQSIIICLENARFLNLVVKVFPSGVVCAHWRQRQPTIPHRNVTSAISTGRDQLLPIASTPKDIDLPEGSNERLLGPPPRGA